MNLAANLAGRPEACLAGGGELGALMRSMDWARTPLGPVASWPQSLRTSVSIMLASGFAACLVWGPEHVLLYNDRYRPILGATRHPMALGGRGAEVFAEEWDVVGPLFRRALAGETVVRDGILLPLDRNGSLEERDYTLSYSPIRDESGGIGGLLAIAAETASRKAERKRVDALAEASQAVDEIREQERRFRLLVESVKDYAIFILDPKGHVATWNAGAERIKGYSAEEIIGRHFSTFYPVEQAESGKCERELATAIAEGRFEEEGWRVRKDGSRFWANVVITPLRNPGGVLLGFAKVTRDLTQRRAAEENERSLVREQLARAASDAASHAKDQFLATISHELRTPLNAMLGWTTLLSRKPRDEAKVERGLEVIERNARAQERLVSDLLDVSRIVSGKLQLSLRRTEVSAVVHAAADVLRPAADAKGVRVVVDVDPDVGVTVADPDRLQQVMWNLLSNAVRYTPQGGNI
jgi:PAS domain S-box-containing protein